jgi:hypothetical protein
MMDNCFSHRKAFRSFSSMKLVSRFNITDAQSDRILIIPGASFGLTPCTMMKLN